MPKYCKRCGATLGEGANFCRQCGTATGPISTPTPASAPLPTRPLDPTEPMTGIVPGVTRSAQLPKNMQPIRRRPVLKLIGIASLTLVVAVIAFVFGSRQSSQKPLTPNPSSVSSPAPSAIPSRQVVTAPPSEPSPPPEPPKKPSSPEAKAVQPPTTRKVETSHLAQEHKEKGTGYLNSNQYQAAIQEFDMVRRLSPEDKDIYYLIGQAHHQLEQFEQALQAYEQCTSGPYAPMAKQHVKQLRKKLGKSN